MAISGINARRRHLKLPNTTLFLQVLLISPNMVDENQNKVRPDST